MSDTDENSASLYQVAEIVSAYVSNNSVPTNQVSDLINYVHQSLMNLGERPPETLQPAVPIKRSITPNYIICLEDGKKLKMLKRHLRASYNLSPEEYRRKWGLVEDYPMVAPKYSARRKELARQIGLGKGATGRRRGQRRAAANSSRRLERDELRVNRF